MALEIVSKAKSFGGYQKVYRHFSSELGCSMKFSLYEPAGYGTPGQKFNVLYYLSGLSCSEENFIQKSGFQKHATEHQFIVVGPDTSPRGLNIPGESDSWDFGVGAGCYLDALKEPWAKNYRMYSYVTKELPKLIEENFPTSGKAGIFGHSMGGHGAIVCGLRNPDLFQSISAFAPITNPINTTWAKDKAWKNFLGEENKDKWAIYDSCEVAKQYGGPPREILIDQGNDDEFLEMMLKPENFQEAVAQNPDKLKLILRMQDGYNHSYFFVSTFIGDHFAHHARILQTKSAL